MTFKQKFKILSLIFTILATACLLMPNIEYQGYMKFNTFELMTMNEEFHILMLLLILFVIGALSINLASISYDRNKILPVITLSLSLLGMLFAILIKQLTVPGSGLLKENWYKDAKAIYGSIIMAVSLGISFASNLIITIRTFILKNNDDYYIVGKNYDEDSDDEEIVDENDEDKILVTPEEQEIINQFNNKE